MYTLSSLVTNIGTFALFDVLFTAASSGGGLCTSTVPGPCFVADAIAGMLRAAAKANAQIKVVIFFISILLT